ncbi:MAG: hypothetical protein MI784_07375, partial [Cytophagales bacterium]|nr:hypothetical protein [Cytophagales bacterium]
MKLVLVYRYAFFFSFLLSLFWVNGKAQTQLEGFNHPLADTVIAVSKLDSLPKQYRQYQKDWVRYSLKNAREGRVTYLDLNKVRISRDSILSIWRKSGKPPVFLVERKSCPDSLLLAPWLNGCRRIKAVLKKANGESLDEV